MRYTFGQAKQYLARYASGYGLTDLGATINTALDELSRSRNFQRLRKVMRFTATSESFALPQDCGALYRAAIDGTPVSIRGTDYEFLHAGPGDLDFATAGFAPQYGIQRLGVYPTMGDPDGVVPLAAFSVTPPPGAVIRVVGKDANGDRIAENVPVTAWSGPEDADTLDPAAVAHTTNSFGEITNIVLPADAAAYISLYGVDEDGGELQFLSRMHPKQRVPEFTRYRLPGFSATVGDTYQLLAEVAVKFVPLVEDEDVIPFDTLLPVQFMMQSMWAMDAGEVKTADEYRQRAELLLLRGEETELERQTLVVLNPMYDGSPGQMSNDYANV